MLICKSFLDSSVLKEMEYDTKKKKLKLVFNNGSIYYYKNVPREIIDNLTIAESAGKYFIGNIKDKFDYERE